MSIFLFIVIFFIAAYVLIKKIKSCKRQGYCNSGTPACQTAKEDKNIPWYKNILEFCIFSSIFWINGLPLLCGGYKYIKDAREITEQGNQTIATITDVHKYEVYDGDGEYSDKRDVYVTYMAAGQKYDSMFKEAAIYDSVGEQIEIYYSSEDPTIIISPEDIKNKVSFQIPMGTIMFVLPFLLLIVGKHISRSRNSP